jgi:DNA-binding response OmpR family regulator
MANKKILIIEDDPDLRLGYHVRLKADSYDTFFATDAVAGVSEARKNQPDLILLDLGLPGGGGFIVIERLKANPHLALIPIIVVSGRAGLVNQERALKEGVKAFLEKPVDNAELSAAIRHALGEPAKHDKRDKHARYDLTTN